MPIEWKEITHIEDGLLKETLALYDSCFPEHVREEHNVFYESIRQRKKNPPNHFHFLVGISDDRVICFVTSHYLADINFGYIVYIAADPKERGKGLGKQTLLKIEELLSLDARNAGHPTLLGIFLETERDVGAENEEEYKENVNRLQFFNHNGYSPIKDYPYVQPPLYNGQTPVPLYLAFKPLTEVDELPYEQVVRAIYYEKYYKMNKISLNILEDCMNSPALSPRDNLVEDTSLSTYW